MRRTKGETSAERGEMGLTTGQLVPIPQGGDDDNDDGDDDMHP